MAGKVTFLHGMHSSRMGVYLPIVKLDDTRKREIEELLRRALQAEEIEMLARMVGIYRGIYKDHYEESHVDAQSIKRTLAAIAKLSDKPAKDALENCDSITKAYIFEALYLCLNARGMEFIDPPGELIAIAAGKAMERLDLKTGRPIKGWQKLLAGDVRKCWEKLSGKPCKAWWSDTKASPSLLFGVIVFSEVAGFPFDPATTAKLLRGEKLR